MQRINQNLSLRLLAVSGDLRQKAAIEALSGWHQVDEISTDAEISTCRYDALLLPMNVSDKNKIPLNVLKNAVHSSGIVLGGRISAADRTELACTGLAVADYAMREEFAVRNAVPTAEGAVQIALSELPVTLHGCPCLILGAGKVSRALQMALRGLQADVTVAARRCSDLVWRQCCESKPLSAPQYS